MIKELLQKYNVEVQTFEYGFLLREAFPGELSWLFELLQYLPVLEQCEREEYISQLPEGLIREIFPLFQKHADLLMEWYNEAEVLSDEKYYAGLVESLLEERYIGLTWQEKIPEDLESFRNEAEKIIESNKYLSEIYSDQESKVHVPDELAFLKPFVLIIPPDILFDEFIKNIPEALINYSENMLIKSTEIRKSFHQKSAISEEILLRIKFWEAAADWYIDSILGKYLED